MAGVVSFIASGKQGVCRNNSQVLSGADEWGVVMFIAGQYGATNPLKKKVKRSQTWAGSCSCWS